MQRLVSLMIIGHAAGIAAKMAIDRHVAVQAVDSGALAAKLKSQRAIFDTRR